MSQKLVQVDIHSVMRSILHLSRLKLLPKEATLSHEQQYEAESRGSDRLSASNLHVIGSSVKFIFRVGAYDMHLWYWRVAL